MRLNDHNIRIFWSHACAHQGKNHLPIEEVGTSITFQEYVLNGLVLAVETYDYNKQQAFYVENKDTTSAGLNLILLLVLVLVLVLVLILVCTSTSTTPTTTTTTTTITITTTITATTTSTLMQASLLLY